MQLNIKELTAKERQMAISMRVDLSNMLAGHQDVTGSGPLDVKLEARGVSGIARIDGELKLPLQLLCSRCLTPLEEELVIPFHERFTQQAELVREEDEENTHIVADAKVELTPYLEEAVWLALPYAPVCREDCLGLCPDCGTNRNERPCACHEQKRDPRLAGLADFFKE
ncbi:YceD family protein [Paenibacillus cymbidii]|uniref:YceD family protein n=1 Tax=Paenibacillus cymbidii TaxID=1639034 RepID=UPI0010815921|nr:DUF177 domain-containing protein [Paenibacillus cymbidii]